MGAIIETWRGSSAVTRWLLGAPRMCIHINNRARDRAEAQEIIMRRSLKVLETLGVDVEITGNLPRPGKGCVCSHNETSLVDVFALSGYAFPHIDLAGAAELYGNIPFARRAIEKIGIRLVPRGNREGTEVVLAEVVEAVKQGARLVWGGEGRLSGVDAVTRFKKGASLIAIRAQVPLIPIAMFGGHQTMPLGSFRARPGKFLIHFCDPVPTAGLVEDDARDLADRIQAIVTEKYEDLRGKWLASR